METKPCTKCREQKPLAQFGRHSGVKSGLQPACRACLSAQTKDWYDKNRERKAATVAAWQEANRDVFEQARVAWRKANPQKLREYTRDWQKANRSAINAYKRQYRHQNPESVVRHEVRRRAAERKACVPWRNPFFVGEIYHLSKLRTRVVGVRFVVDHVVPLRHPMVCGLHVEHNLQVIEGHINEQKGNRWWPDMWED